MNDGDARWDSQRSLSAMWSALGPPATSETYSHRKKAIFWGLGIVGTATVALFVALGLAMGAIAIFGIPS